MDLCDGGRRDSGLHRLDSRQIDVRPAVLIDAAGLSSHAEQRSGLIIWEPAGGQDWQAVLSKGKKHVQDNHGPMSRPNGRYRDRVRPYCRVDLGCRSHCLEYGRQQSHWHVLDRCKETLGRNIIGIGGGVPHHHPLAFGSVGELHNRCCGGEIAGPVCNRRGDVQFPDRGDAALRQHPRCDAVG